VRSTETQPERASKPADRSKAMRMERLLIIHGTQRPYLSESSIAPGNGNGCPGDNPSANERPVRYRVR
jgi:hypothetical protein